MLTRGINLINFKKKKINLNIKKKLSSILSDNNEIFTSLGKFYQYKFKKKILLEYKKKKKF